MEFSTTREGFGLGREFSLQIPLNFHRNDEFSSQCRVFITTNNLNKMTFINTIHFPHSDEFHQNWDFFHKNWEFFLFKIIDFHRNTFNHFDKFSSKG